MHDRGISLRKVGKMPSDETFAFFDVDDTLVTCKTMFSFQDFWFKTRHPTNGQILAAEFSSQVDEFRSSGRPREELNSFYYSTFAGRKPEDVAETARLWFEKHRRNNPAFYVPAALSALVHHRQQGHEPVLVSGSMVDIISPISEELRTRHVLATRLSIVDGHYSGIIVPPQTIGAGKAVAIRELLSREGADASKCWAYGDHLSDLPMLEAVGHPVVVSDDESMMRLAKQRSWQLLDPTVVLATALGSRRRISLPSGVSAVRGNASSSSLSPRLGRASLKRPRRASMVTAALAASLASTASVTAFSSRSRPATNSAGSIGNPRAA